MILLCVRCGRCERFANLLLCANCVNGLIQSEQSETPVLRPFVPEWRKRLTARDETGRLAA